MRFGFAELVAQIADDARGRGRYVFGLAGPPGSGKSTVAGRLAEALGAVVVPMDGFHLDNMELDRLGLSAVKGAPETFDADGFVRLVEQLQHADRSGFGPIVRSCRRPRDRRCDHGRPGRPDRHRGRELPAPRTPTVGSTPEPVRPDRLHRRRLQHEGRPARRPPCSSRSITRRGSRVRPHVGRSECSDRCRDSTTRRRGDRPVASLTAATRATRWRRAIRWHGAEKHTAAASTNLCGMCLRCCDTFRSEPLR